VERKSDQTIRDRQDKELEQERKDRAERLGHDIRTPLTERRETDRARNDFESLK
jgi:hypothetical protein